MSVDVHVEKERRTDLEALGVPSLDLLDAWHLVQTVRQFVEFLDAVGEANRQLVGEKLRGAQESALRVCNT